MTKHDAHDALDFIGLTVPLTLTAEGNPVGHGRHHRATVSRAAVLTSASPCPACCLSAATRHSRFLRQGSRQHRYGGIAADVTYFEPSACSRRRLRQRGIRAPANTRTRTST
ncbi:MAG: hypothetical protein ACLSAH_22045 [Bilophila wadsworthia]